LNCQFDQLWLGLLDFIFGSKTSLSVFSQIAQPFREFFISLYSPLRALSNIYNMWIFVVREHHHHFQILYSGEAQGTIAHYCSNGNFQIWSLSILIFNWSPPFADFLISLLLFNCFLKISLSKLHQNLLKNFLKCNKIYGNFYLPFCPLVKYQLIFNA
jgi:hypothetical protein